MKKLGLIVNPIAGMGGRVGLKGTDGKETLQKAIALGAQQVSPGRTVQMLRKLGPIKEKFTLLTCPDGMGEDEAREAGFDPKVLGKIDPGKTTAADTKRAARGMVEGEVDLIVIVGGDGTIRDVHDTLGTEVPVVAVPAGVKLHSAVFSTSPEAAAETVMKFLWDELPLREAEVMDVDETAYRTGRLSAKLYGHLLVPYEPVFLQGSKLASIGAEAEAEQQEAVASQVVENMESGTIYLLGPGTTTRAVAEALREEKTLLGVDVIQDKKVIAWDVNERQILELIQGKKSKIIVSPIGGQGFIFGRGNQQLSPEVLRKVGKDNVLVLASPQKLLHIRALKVDTGDSELDKEFKGHIRVVTGYRTTQMVGVA
jgi:predicted polyphosphate/ATP-dependent NAD kinase